MELQKHDHKLRVKFAEEQTRKNEALAKVTESDRTITRLRQEIAAASVESEKLSPEKLGEILDKFGQSILNEIQKSPLKLGKQSKTYQGIESAIKKAKKFTLDE